MNYRDYVSLSVPLSVGALLGWILFCKCNFDTICNMTFINSMDGGSRGVGGWGG